MNRLLISAAHKSSGKTTISIGLCAALHAAGQRVQPFKKGPDYIDPMWLGQAAARPCINLDFYTMERDEILATAHKYAADSDIAIIEGNKGLYDGLDIEGSNSNAALAQLTSSPIILVIDVQGMTRGIAPLVLGYQAFQPELNIAGVILNQIRGARHEDKLRAVLAHYTDVPVVGAVYHNPALAITERHLGLVPSNENHEAHPQIEYIGKLIGEQVDLAQLQAIARSAPPLPAVAAVPESLPHEPDIRIAIAHDSAFGFYYPDDLQSLREAGAELVEFNTMTDHTLPECDGLFLGGGFPETHMVALEANLPLRQHLKAAIDNGLPTYAECGGLMYLARSISWNDTRCDMVGAIAGDITMYPRPVGRGYVLLEENAHHPWPAAADSRITPFPGHEFHYSALENLPDDACFAYNVKRGMGINGQYDGLVYKNLLASYAHLRDTSKNHWAARFVGFIRSLKDKNPV